MRHGYARRDHWQYIGAVENPFWLVRNVSNGKAECLKLVAKRTWAFCIAVRNWRSTAGRFAFAAESWSSRRYFAKIPSKPSAQTIAVTARDQRHAVIRRFTCSTLLQCMTNWVDSSEMSMPGGWLRAAHELAVLDKRGFGSLSRWGIRFCIFWWFCLAKSESKAVKRVPQLESRSVHTYQLGSKWFSWQIDGRFAVFVANHHKSPAFNEFLFESKENQD